MTDNIADNVIIRDVFDANAGTRHIFFCPACRCGHWFDDKTWKWNGDRMKPTITPSLFVNGSVRCHSFVKDGRIQFLTDCQHELAGKTVDMECF